MQKRIKLLAGDWLPYMGVAAALSMPLVLAAFDGLPYAVLSSDESYLVQEAIDFLGTKKLVGSNHLPYPNLSMFLTAFFLILELGMMKLAGVIDSFSQYRHIYLLAPGYLHMAGRAVGILGGWLTIFSTAVFCRICLRECLPRETAGEHKVTTCLPYLAMLGVAVSPTLIMTSSIAKPDPLLAGLATLLLAACMRSLRTENPAPWLLCGVLLGLASATKQTAIALLPLPVAAHIMAAPPGGWRSPAHPFLHKRLYWMAMATLLTGFLASPATFLHLDIILERTRLAQSRMGRLASSHGRFLWIIFDAPAYFLFCLSSALPMALLAWKHKRLRLVPIPWICVLLLSGNNLEAGFRWLLPVIPVSVSAWLVWAVASCKHPHRIHAAWRNRPLLSAGAIAAACVALSTMDMLPFAASALKTHHQIQIRDYLEQHYPDAGRIILTPMSIRPPFLSRQFYTSISHEIENGNPLPAWLRREYDRPVYEILYLSEPETWQRIVKDPLPPILITKGNPHGADAHPESWWKRNPYCNRAARYGIRFHTVFSSGGIVMMEVLRAGDHARHACNARGFRQNILQPDGGSWPVGRTFRMARAHGTTKNFHY